MTLPDKIVDFHVHLFPDRMFDAVWRHFSEVYKWDVIYQLYCKESVSHLRERGVGPIVYSNYAHRAGVAKGLNDWNKKILDEIDDLYCFGAFSPLDDEAMKIAKDALKHPKMLGFKLQLLVQEHYPADERFFPLYDLVMERGKRILFHVGNGPAGNRFVGYDNFEKLLDRRPDLPCNVAHMGGMEYTEFFGLLDNHENIYLDTSFTFIPKMAPLFGLEDVFADLKGFWGDRLEKYKDRIVYGSDFPNLIFPREDEIECLRGLSLSREFYDKVFYENGVRLIGKHAGD
ncbi:MAG: amidohydrolase family protein [Deltaproteobacteria bacterium]|uniref:Amidohydrolase family protein n=1 Tax=Candidatus Zymogenus saltonus TaxID=2844893 RepID=A0A9D8KBZ7_9DELT|nr:amidohydrolase family protein [Candidatus Zymogenus saltonus]